MIKLSSPATEEFWEIPVLFEDEHLLAIDKPPGLPIAADKEDARRASLIHLLHKGIAEAKPWAATRGLSFLMHAHRLDDEASGVLLLAKSKAALVQLSDGFGSEQKSLEFLTLAQGTPEEDHFSVEAKIGPHPAREGVMRIDPRQGKRSKTLFEVSERFRDWTLLKCFPLTHRLHQIRVHLARAGLRAAGDSCYGGRPLLLSKLKSDYHLKPHHTERPLIGQVCLHASRLAIPHPITAAQLKIEAPWPKHLRVAVKYLRQYGQ